MSDRSASTFTGQRDCALYRFWVRHPETGQRVLGYIGETGRMPFQRLMEHVYQKPWADTIVGWEVDSVTYPNKQAVLAAELAAIQAERPLYNIEGNMGNPDRIPPWVAVAQRQARQPDWVPPPKGARVPPQVPRQRNRRAPAGRPVRPSAAPSRLSRMWATYRTPIIVWGVLWLGLFAAAWWAGADAWTGWREPGNAAIGATLGLGVLAYAYRRAVDRVRRERRRANRRPARRKRSRR